MKGIVQIFYSTWPDIIKGIVHIQEQNCTSSDVKQQILRLIGGIPTPLKNMKVNCDDDIPH